MSQSGWGRLPTIIVGSGGSDAAIDPPGDGGTATPVAVRSRSGPSFSNLPGPTTPAPDAHRSAASPEQGRYPCPRVARVGPVGTVDRARRTAQLLGSATEVSVVARGDGRPVVAGCGVMLTLERKTLSG